MSLKQDGPRSYDPGNSYVYFFFLFSLQHLDLHCTLASALSCNQRPTMLLHGRLSLGRSGLAVTITLFFRNLSYTLDSLPPFFLTFPFLHKQHSWAYGLKTIVFVILICS
jgi:hypothetical protein